MRKILSLVLALSMVLGMFSFAFAANLTDIDGEYYEAAVEALVELEVINGYNDHTFKGNNIVTRAELAKMLVIALGQDQAAKIAKGTTQFSDVAGEHWASGYINVAAQSKVIVGYPDGTFDPEATVTYAEAVTMALRALGYKNVVESAGTWPTNYITKANELQLLKDMKDVDAEDGAKRGNVAILLWNMLRTEMWDIDSENQTNGMTYRKTEEPMLNIKFPDYEYEDEATFVSYSVDDTKVTAVVNVPDRADPIEAELKSGDLLRLIPGMKVAYLYNSDEEVFLTLTNVDTLAEGRVDKNGKLNGKEYTGIDRTFRDKYVVVILDGKRVVDGVILPDGGTEIDGDSMTLKKAQKTITEDVLVIIDGEWCTGEDLEEKDVYTKIDASALHRDNSGEFYVVARNRVEGTFESLTTEEDADNFRAYVEVDGDEYDALQVPAIYEWNEKNEEYDDVALADVYSKKDNKYLDEDVTLALNYLDEVINMYFEELKDEDDADIRFFVLSGKQIWYDSSEDGMKYYARMTDTAGDEEKQVLEAGTGAELFDDIGSGAVYKCLTAIYQNALDANNGDKDAAEEALREAILEFVLPFNINDDDELERPKEADLNAAYVMGMATPANGNDEILDDDNYLKDGFKVTKSTKVIKITPELDDDEVVGVEVEVFEGPDELDGVTEAMYVVEVDDDGNPKLKVSYVFVAQDARSSELNYGLVEAFGTRKGVDTVTISGTRYDLADDSVEAAIGNLVSFRVNDEEAEIREVLKTTDLDDGKAEMVTKVEDEIVYLVNETIDTEAETVTKFYEDYTFVLATVTADKDDNLEFDDEVEVLGKGIESASFKKGDRIVASKVDDVIVIVRGVKDTEEISGGAIVD